MFDTSDNAYNVDKKIYYSAVRLMIIRSLEKIVREELNRPSSQRSVNLHKMEEEEEEDVLLLPVPITCLTMILYYLHRY